MSYSLQCLLLATGLIYELCQMRLDSRKRLNVAVGTKIQSDVDLGDIKATIAFFNGSRGEVIEFFQTH